MKDKFSFVYLDVGGVVIKDFSETGKWKELTDELGISDEKRGEFNRVFKEFEKETNLGRKTEDFLPILRDKLGIEIPSNYSFLMAFVNRFERNEGIEKVLDEAKKKYGLGLLTNMYAGMFEAINKKGLMPKIVWNIVVDSSLVKCKKPEPEIYKIAENLAKTPGREILFVDNKQKNIETAMKLGWKTHFFDSKDYKKSNEKLKLLLK